MSLKKYPPPHQPSCSICTEKCNRLGLHEPLQTNNMLFSSHELVTSRYSYALHKFITRATADYKGHDLSDRCMIYLQVRSKQTKQNSLSTTSQPETSRDSSVNEVSPCIFYGKYILIRFLFFQIFKTT